MKLADWIPENKTLDSLQGVEKTLESRRYKSRWSLAVAGISALVQIGVLLKIGDLTHLTPGRAFLPAIVLFVAAIAWVLARYTGFLFKQSSEPFRYTFSMKPFGNVESTPGARFAVDQIDQINLLSYDLTELLNKRVRRFSLRESPAAGAEATKGTNPTSHFDIEGSYAIRQEENEGWILHVWPRVRAGAEGNSFTLAYAVRLPLEETPEGKNARAMLTSAEYSRLVERVYSSVATEIYKQIEADLRDKMTLFPTNSLRALARVVEAEDFENSNTIDAYDRALEMYRSSLDELSASRVQQLMKRIALEHGWLVSQEWTGLRAALEAEAKTKLGYSRCLIYRRLVSEMAGRQRNAIFETRPKLKGATVLLAHSYNSFLPEGTPRLSTNLEQLMEAQPTSEIALTRDAVPQPMWRKALYQKVREDLCETFAVAALAYSILADSEKARNALQLADAFAANSTPVRVRIFLLLAKAQLAPGLPQKLTYLNEARELNPDSEITLYRFALFSDLLARDNDDVTKRHVGDLVEKYEAVLKVNPANIASLIGQGYLLWIVDELDAARKKLRTGIEFQKIVAQTFVGDLKYCLARVEVERAAAPKQPSETEDDAKRRTAALLNQAVFDYQEAMLADRSVAASDTDPQGSSMSTYYDFLNATILEAYGRLAERARRISETGGFDEVATRQALHYALNDYGNACFNYYLRFHAFTGTDVYLRQSFDLLEEAVGLFREDVMTVYNRFSALKWGGDAAKAEVNRLMKTLIEKSAELPPAAFANVFSDANEYLSRNDPRRPDARAITEGGPAVVDTLRNKTKSEEQPPSPMEGKRASAVLRHEEKVTQLEDLREPVLNFLREKSTLCLFKEYLSPSDIGKLLKTVSELFQRDKLWPGYGDREVFALLVLAKVWKSREEEQQGSRDICDHILTLYYPEDFEVALTLLACTTEPVRQAKVNALIDRGVDRFMRYDAKSRNNQSWLLSRCDNAVLIQYPNWPDFSQDADYGAAIDIYKKEEQHCKDLPAFYDSLALAYENHGRQSAALLAKDGGDIEAGEALLLTNQLVLTTRETTCQLDPKNPNYRDRLLTTLGRRSLGIHTFQDPLANSDVPRVIEVELSNRSTSELGFGDASFPAGLLQKIKELRESLTQDAGFTLPGINFRDNAAFEQGKYRLLVRGVPQLFEQLQKDETQELKWDQLTLSIKQAALRKAAHFYSTQDCFYQLRERAKQDGHDYSDISTDAECLFALTWVLKALLNERAPISEFAAIVQEFRRCRLANLDLISTVEEIRCLPKIRRKLWGNSEAEAAVVKALNRDLEHRIYNAIDWAASEPMMVNPPADIRQELRLIALSTKREAGKRCAVILTGAAIRPFAWGIVEDLGVSVLSRRELVPATVSPTKDSDAAQSK
jgi:hypothetical protein